MAPKVWHQQWKTIAGIVGLALTSLAWIFGWIDEDVAALLGTVIGAFTGVSLKLGLNRTECRAAEAVRAANAAEWLAGKATKGN